MTWQEHVRKRPGMYLGQVNNKGYVDTLRGIISHMITTWDCDTVRLTFKGDTEGIIEFDNVANASRRDIAILDTKIFTSICLPTLNALSKWMQVAFDDGVLGVQSFAKGETETEIAKEDILCDKITITYSLDKSIWGDEFKWNSNYLSYELREFCYLNPTVRFEITDLTNEQSNTNTYKFVNGLSDRLEIEILNGIGTCYFKHHIKYKHEHFQLDAAFAFRQYSVDQTFVRTYVNNEITPEHGSHLDGLLKGLTYGVMKHFQAQNLVNEYKISEMGIKQGLVCLMNISMDNAVYSGCVKNKLANPEIIEPIAEYISDLLYQSILNDPDSTTRLIDKFKMEKL